MKHPPQQRSGCEDAGDHQGALDESDRHGAILQRKPRGAGPQAGARFQFECLDHFASGQPDQHSGQGQLAFATLVTAAVCSASTKTKSIFLIISLESPCSAWMSGESEHSVILRTGFVLIGNQIFATQNEPPGHWGSSSPNPCARRFAPEIRLVSSKASGVFYWF